MSIEISALPSRQEHSRGPWAAEAVGALVIGALSLSVGLAVGAAWRYLAPPVRVVVSVTDGQKAGYFQNPETKGFVGQDGVFAVCAVVAALVLALVAFFWFRRRAPIGAALALGGAGIGASYLAAWFGVRIGPGSGSGSALVATIGALPANSVFDLPLKIRATGVIWLWPAFAVGLYFLLTLVFGPSDPQPESAAPQYEFPQWADPVDLTAPAPEPPSPGPSPSN